ncbi:MAG TPA: pitrilysin family protein [Anaerolineales bacterium]
MTSSAAPFTQVTLSNGLQVFLKEIHTAPLVSSWLWYRVGSRDETPGLTGISHWTEHMQFKGTPRFPATVLDRAISREGGNWNAMTFLDWTSYFETMPANKIDLVLDLEADRMVNSLFDEKEVASERTVVISEREGNENEPIFRLGEAIQRAAFHVHPYQHEVIGERQDLQGITRENLYAHYRRFYIPNNAVLSVAGDFKTNAMLARIRELFEPIPAGAAPLRFTQPEPPLDSEIQLSIEGPGETTYLQVAYRFPPASHPDFFPLGVMDSLLAGPSSLNMFGGGLSSKTSRLYRALVDKEVVVGVSGGASTTIDPFLYYFTLTVHPKRTREEALAALDAELDRLRSEPISEEEVHRAVKQVRALFSYGSESITNQAFWMGYTEMFASHAWFLDFLKVLEQVTPEDVQRVARQYLQQNNRVVATYLPAGKSD